MIQNKYLYILPAIIALILLLITLWDFFTDQSIILPLLATYAILFILTLILWYIGYITQPKQNTITLFEKTLKGTLTHFKCPQCGTIFALKKSKSNNKKSFYLTCPSCQIKGLITANPTIIHQPLPLQKSPRSKYQCTHCGEWITIWSEGTTSLPHSMIYSCPYCGAKKPLHQLSV
ncbi:MAG: hypothetical protein KKG04_02615 [Candidatus Thermoplasmatota archaeon]|nr:hypothetical protein [Candidatus Thermoplasmatota archaeon]